MELNANKMKFLLEMENNKVAVCAIMLILILLFCFKNEEIQDTKETSGNQNKTPESSIFKYTHPVVSLMFGIVRLPIVRHVIQLYHYRFVKFIQLFISLFLLSSISYLFIIFGLGSRPELIYYALSFLFNYVMGSISFAFLVILIFQTKIAPRFDFDIEANMLALISILIILGYPYLPGLSVVILFSYIILWYSRYILIKTYVANDKDTLASVISIYLITLMIFLPSLVYYGIIAFYVQFLYIISLFSELFCLNLILVILGVLFRVIYMFTKSSYIVNKTQFKFVYENEI